MKAYLSILFVFLCQLFTYAQQTEKTPPTQGNIAYGSHPRQVFDFYKATSDKPTALVFFIHGGAWTHGDKTKIYKDFPDLNVFLENGISIVSVNYRLINASVKAFPAVSVPLSDIRTALKYVKAYAKELNIDKNEIVLCGGSAGACSSLLIALTPDTAQKRSKHLLDKESTEVKGVFALRAQTTLDPVLVQQWIPNNTYGGHAFNVKKIKGNPKASFQNFLTQRDTLLSVIEAYSPYHLVTKKAPPLFLYYPYAPQLNHTNIKDPIHSTNYGVYFKERCEEVGATCELIHAENGYTATKVSEDILSFLKY